MKLVKDILIYQGVLVFFRDWVKPNSGRVPVHSKYWSYEARKWNLTLITRLFSNICISHCDSHIQHMKCNFPTCGIYFTIITMHGVVRTW